ncbi:sensor histidine kinase [Terrimonas pollutisoli]|uniref:sensor histidine kinase n=1 Tax=Terrimonas pollutisoli TaxID=3034147 RepID=UPI0023ED8D9D|nr:PAS domain S-box protein [Terrimonas sp. H1YJ31]
MQRSTLKTGFSNEMIRWSVILAISVIAIALLVLIGWQFDILVLTRPLPGAKAMNPIAALAFIFAAVSFLFQTTDQLTGRKRKTGYIFAILVLLIGTLKFFSLTFGLDFQIDALLFQNKLQSDRIVPIAAINFMLTGIALLLLHAKTINKRTASDIILLTLAGISLFAILGYLYQVKIFYGVFTYLPMAIHSAACFLLLSLSMLFFNADKGLMKEITGPFAGSMVARRLIPAAILVPALLGLLRMVGHWTSSFTLEFGVNILVFSIIVVLMGIVLYSVTLLNKRDFQSKLAENALREREEQIQTIFKAAPDAVIVIDHNGYVTQWNPKAESIFGWSSDEVKGKLLSDTIIPDRYREAHKTGLNRFLQTGKGPVIGKTVEIQAINKNNIELDISLSISPAISNGKYLFIGFVRDISEQKKAELKLKESEEKFHKAFRASAAGITITRLSDSTYIEVNDAFANITGYSKEELLNHSSTELGLVVDMEKREEILQLIREHGSAKSFEMMIRNKSGKILDILASVETILLKGEKFAINIIYDITERKKAQRELETVNKELEAFSYSVSHDLRAPLRIIDGYTKAVMEDYAAKLDEEGNRLLGIITANAQRMGTLIDDLLHFSRLGRRELTIRRVDMNELVRSVIAGQHLVNTNNVTLHIGNLEPAWCDNSLIQQVWVNFISNAIKYSREKEKPVIEITSVKTAHEVIYNVKDNGVGFDMKYVNKLFGVFQRLHRLEEFEGTGVGLALVQRIVSRHGGRVWANAEVNKGATFYFSLPAMQN